MSIIYHHDVEQGSLAWNGIRCGTLTASAMKLVVTPSLKAADNEKTRTHIYELLAQRVTKHVEPTFQSYDMERGNFDEGQARAKYSETYEMVTECGFVTNDDLGFTIGYSPDGLVGAEGLIEVKSRLQKWQMQTLIEHVASGTIPEDFTIQCQSALFVTGRKWLDFISYSCGMVMATIRTEPIAKYQDAIAEAATAFEQRISEKLKIYEELLASDVRLVSTERLIYL